ncbi:hypothetical protein PROPEN_01848 [Proteus penneri ATCC 35198]|nr:hypothetical protein PROPEN_01848 [Proteus penneri ATCC 35198]
MFIWDQVQKQARKQLRQRQAFTVAIYYIMRLALYQVLMCIHQVSKLVGLKEKNNDEQ